MYYGVHGILVVIFNCFKRRAEVRCSQTRRLRFSEFKLNLKGNKMIHAFSIGVSPNTLVQVMLIFKSLGLFLPLHSL